jgi:hypothetical protein
MTEDDGGLKAPRTSREALNELCAPLGEFVMLFAHLERDVTTRVAGRMKISYKQSLFLETYMPNISARINLLGALSNLFVNEYRENNGKSEPTLIPLIGKTISLLHQANACRNSLVHEGYATYGLSDKQWAVWKPKTKVTGFDLGWDDNLNDVAPQFIVECTQFIMTVRRVMADLFMRIDHIDHPELWPPPLHSRYHEGSPLQRRAHDRKKAAVSRPPPPSHP